MVAKRDLALVAGVLLVSGVTEYQVWKQYLDLEETEVAIAAQDKPASIRLRDFYISSIENQSKTNRPYASPSPLLELL